MVIDASVAVTWLFADRDRPDCDLLQDRLVALGGAAPDLWRWEVASVWLKKARRDGLAPAQLTAIETIFGFFSVFVRIEVADASAFDRALALARAHSLSSYDAAYLELALRAGLPLATLDRALARACASEGVPVLPAAV